jgi:catechol 2,3-dioxygenase-like lactoylglutathione lyase family enzyme
MLNGLQHASIANRPPDPREFLALPPAPAIIAGNAEPVPVTTANAGRFGDGGRPASRHRSMPSGRHSGIMPSAHPKSGTDMIDHTGLAVSDLDKSKAFYVAALRPLGIDLVMELTAAQTGTAAHAGFGAAGKPFFWIGDHGAPCSGVHVAFTAETRAQVDEFHRAALKAGARSNGEPGPRPHYHESYYGAFVLDPDGNNIEAVCHKPA